MSKRRPKGAPPRGAPRSEPVEPPEEPSPTPWPERAFWRAAAVVALAPLLVFARGVPSSLLATWDDDRFIRDFEPVHAYSLEGLITIWSEPHFQAFHPLHLMSYWLDVPWAGPDATMIGVVSALLWAGALVLVLAVMRGLGLGPTAAVFATLAYGLHPVQVEAVTWATGRKEILATIFVSLSILMHLRSEAISDRPAWLSRALYLLAALSKTTTLPLPGLLFLIDVLLRRRPWRASLIRQLPALALGVGLAVVVVFVWEANQMIRPDAGGGEAGGRALLVLATMSHHLSTALWPASLSPVYPIERSADFGAFALLFGPLAFVLALAVAWKKRWPRLAFSALGFALLLLPVLNLIPMYWLRADRYLSLPLLALAFGVGALVDAGRPRSPPRAVLAIAALLVVALAARTVQHAPVYADDLRLWSHATSAQPDAHLAWIKLGEVRRDSGDLDGAVEAYQRAVALAPELRLTHAGLFYAVALRDEARYEVSAPEDWDLDYCVRGEVRYSDHISLRRREQLDSQPAWRAMRCFHASLERADHLSGLGADLVRAGYRDAVVLVLSRLFQLRPPSPEQLEDAALGQLRAEREWLARVYLSQLTRPPRHPVLVNLLAPQTDATDSTD